MENTLQLFFYIYILVTLEEVKQITIFTFIHLFVSQSLTTSIFNTVSVFGPLFISFDTVNSEIFMMEDIGVSKTKAHG